MQVLELTLLVLVGHLVHGYSPGIDFVGIGYNLLKANPEGGVGGAGGVDPGLNGVRKILQLSSGTVPKEVAYKPRHSCLQQKSTHVYYGSKSYQSRLGVGVTASGQGNTGVATAAFSLSAGYKRAYSETNKAGNVIFDDETICNLGTARFTEELSSQHNLHVTINFAAALCSLPVLYNSAVYMKFLDDWGTHVVMQVDFGTKLIKRYESSRTEFIKHVQKSGGFGLSVGGFLSLDFKTFKASSAYKLRFGTYQSTLTSGSTNQPEPIGLTIKTIAEALNKDYWQGSSVLKACGHSLSVLRFKQIHLVTALTGYAKFKLFTPPTDPQLRIPLTWPSGTYGLIKTTSGCPAGRVTWHEGMRHYDDYSRHRAKTSEFASNYYIKNSNEWSNPNHIAGTKGRDIDIEFCMKGDNKITEYDGDWPAGDYCILKYGDCPKGFQSGSIFWDDNDTRNHNFQGGTVPDGQYDADTRIDFCCRQDALPTHEILLPTEKPFILFKYTRECQHIKDMVVREEYIVWTDDNYHGHDKVTGAHPFDDGGHDLHKLHFCYYAKSGSSLIG
ncbi:uncharacterized protein LOC126830600 [Patella vulgata]|uniref:uncharacterized protein LOC126830600 n=1 Tax=Patella vulgata TaxID=6465 RepID=UPI0024A93163|nr:uncharacterized protein LOC126830600 [Patella vulgata]